MKKILGVFLVLAGLWTRGQDTVQLKLALDTAHGTNRVSLLNELCYQLSFKNPQSAIRYGKESLKLAATLNNPKLLAATYNDLSIPYFLTGDFELMLDLNRKALAIRQLLGDSLLMAASYSKIGNAYQEMAKLDSSLLYYRYALAIYRAYHQQRYEIQILNNIANINEKAGDYAGAVELHKEVAAIALELQDSVTYLQVQGNQANTLDRMKKYKEARKLYYELIPLSIQLGFKEYLGNIYLGLGVNYRNTQDYDSSLVNYQKAYRIFTRLKSTTALAITSIDLGKTFLKIHHTDSAAIYMKQGLEWALQTHSYNHIYNGYLGLSELEKTNGNFELALKYNELARTYEDSVFTDRIADKISEFRTAYQTEKKEKELAEKQLEVESHKRLLLIISSLAVIVLLLMLFAYFRSRQIHQLNLKQAIITEKQNGLDAVIYAQEEERKRLAKELHDGVAQSLGMAKLAFSRFQDTFKKDTTEQKEFSILLNQLEEANQEIRNVSHQMMPRALEELGLIAALNDMVYKTNKYSELTIDYEVLGMDEGTRFNPKIEVSLYRIAQELLNNSIKHSNATQVTIQLRKTSQFLVLSIEDNGTGLSGEQKDGIGLMNIKSRAEHVNGSFNIESNEGQGTSAIIRIPV